MAKVRALALTTALILLIAGCGSGTPAPASAPAGVDPHAGHVAGTPAAPVALRTGERFQTLTMPSAYTPAAPTGGTDDYRCIVVDPRLTKAQFLTGAQFTPGNTPIVHHAIVFAEPPGNAAAIRAKDAATPGEGWTCFGNDEVPGGQPGSWVDTWTPNGAETVLKQDVGFPLEPGSLLILQVHYNLLAADGKTGEKDQSSVRLRLTAGTAATKTLDTVRLPAPIELPCAAGESGRLCDRTTAIADVGARFGAEEAAMEPGLVKRCDNGTPVPGNTQHCDIQVPAPMTVYAALGHMHLLGRSIKIELNPGTAGATTLLDVPAFNYDDQKFEQLATPVAVKAGDTVRVTCTHDATLRKLLPQLRKLPPRYVVWGDGTSDEMCLGLLIAAPAAP
jgi:hypothetical protein